MRIIRLVPLVVLVAGCGSKRGTPVGLDGSGGAAFDLATAAADLAASRGPRNPSFEDIGPQLPPHCFAGGSAHFEASAWPNQVQDCVPPDGLPGRCERVQTVNLAAGMPTSGVAYWQCVGNTAVDQDNVDLTGVQTLTFDWAVANAVPGCTNGPQLRFIGNGPQVIWDGQAKFQAANNSGSTAHVTETVTLPAGLTTGRFEVYYAAVGCGAWLVDNIQVH